MLALLALAACGGRAQVGDVSIQSADGASNSAPGFLFECQQSCAAGLGCVEGICSTVCEADDECSAFAATASCSRPRPGAGRRCAVPCDSDDGCVSLGAGSFCSGAGCVAAPLEKMPLRFDTLDLSRRIDGVSAPRGSACDPSVLATSLSLDRRTRRLVRSSCERVAGGDYALEQTQRVLGDAELELVRDAFAALRLDGESRCDPQSDVLRLDVQPPSGPLLSFSDRDHAACPADEEPRLSSTLDKLGDLYRLLMRLSDSG